jgi:hypothetical protein
VFITCGDYENFGNVTSVEAEKHSLDVKYKQIIRSHQEIS